MCWASSGSLFTAKSVPLPHSFESSDSFWFQKIELDFENGLLPCITNPLVVSGLLAPILTLLFVNQQKKIEQEQVSIDLMMSDKYPRFKEYEIGFLACWNLVDPRFSSQLSAEGTAILSKASHSLAKTLLRMEPDNCSHLLLYGDILFQDEQYRQALCSYLKAGALQTSFFCDPSPHSFAYSQCALNRMITCLFKIQGL